MIGFINYLLHYRENIKEIEELTKKYDNERSDTYKANKQIQELKEKNTFLNERNDRHLETIKEKNKQIRKLKKQNKFLMDRDNKLQQIEAMFENKRVVLRDLKEIVKGEENDNNK